MLKSLVCLSLICAVVILPGTVVCAQAKGGSPGFHALTAHGGFPVNGERQPPPFDVKIAHATSSSTLTPARGPGCMRG
jgi:hypothetical protein